MVQCLTLVSGNDEGLFVMDAMSGNMTLNGTIDAEDTDFYRIIVKVNSNFHSLL